MVNEGAKGEGGRYTNYKDQSIIMHISDIFHNDTHYFMKLINTSENKKNSN